MTTRPTHNPISSVFVRAMEIRRNHRSTETDNLICKFREVIDNAENADMIECTPREAVLIGRIVEAFARIVTTLRSDAERDAYATAIEALDTLYIEQGTLSEDKMIRNMAEKLAPEYNEDDNDQR